MCVLCGEFVAHVHWTERDRKAATSAGSGEAVSGDERRRARAQDRLRTARAANLVLRHYGLRLDDWAGSKYIVRDQKGNAVIIQHVGELWGAAERMARRPLDPLAPELIDALTRRGGA